MALTTGRDYVEEKEGMLSIGDHPFNMLLPEPIISGLKSRLFHACSNEPYVPDS